jgi:hypothetical protein
MAAAASSVEMDSRSTAGSVASASTAMAARLLIGGSLRFVGTGAAPWLVKYWLGVRFP